MDKVSMSGQSADASGSELYESTVVVMNKAEFDKFACEYNRLQAENISISGEDPEFFVEYKVRDTASILEKYKSYRSSDPLRILDFGAGIGRSVPFFKHFFPNCILTCMDVSGESLAAGEEKYKGEANFKHFNGGHIPECESTYHIVFASCVFHHIQHDLHNDVLMEMYRVLKHLGLIIIFEHNPYNPLTLHAFRRCIFDRNAQLIKGRRLRQRIQKNGFIDTVLCYRIFFPHSLRLLRPLEEFLGWFPLGAQYYVCGQKP
jgi:SAM-dependent methyltransferase